MDISKLVHIHVGSYIYSDIACGILESEQVVSYTNSHTYQARNWSGGGRPYELESDIKLYICQ